MAGKRPMRADARRNREAIIAAARTAFDNDEHFPFDDFAARAGVGVGTLYRHFPTREALAAAVYEEEVIALCAHASNPERTAQESLAAFLRGFVEYIVEHAALARALAAVVAPPVQAAGGSQLERTVADLLSRGSEEGTIREDASVGAVMVILHGIGSASDRPLWASESRAVAELLIAGLSTPHGEDTHPARPVEITPTA